MDIKLNDDDVQLTAAKRPQEEIQIENNMALRADRPKRSQGRPKAVTTTLQEISAKNVEILELEDITRDNAGNEVVALSNNDTGAMAVFAERKKIESQLNSVYYLATDVTAINDRGQLLLYNPMAALKAIELLIDIKGLKDNQRASRGGVNVFAQNVRSIDLKPKS